MPDELTEQELKRLESMVNSPAWGPWNTDILSQQIIDAFGRRVGLGIPPELAEEIVAAHNALPRLLAEVRRRRGRQS